MSDREERSVEERALAALSSTVSIITSESFALDVLREACGEEMPVGSHAMLGGSLVLMESDVVHNEGESLSRLIDLKIRHLARSFSKRIAPELACARADWTFHKTDGPMAAPGLAAWFVGFVWAPPGGIGAIR